MNKNETLQNVESLVKKFTNDFLMNGSEVVCSDEIAGQLNVTRSSVSRYLNELFSEKKLIKINTRPVVFFDAQVLESHARENIDRFDFISVKEMFDYYKLAKIKYDFDDLIGRKDTLFEIISSLKSVVGYPDNRVVTIHFHGHKGVGKKRLANALLQYCRDNKIRNLESELYTFKCSSAMKNMNAILFGTSEKEGLLEKEGKRILYLERVELLTTENQMLLANYLSLIKEKKVHNKYIIFATETAGMIDDLKDKMLASYILPDLKDRPKIERISFICLLLEKESKKLDKQVKISSFALQVLSDVDFANNMDGLKGAIINALANANMKQSKDVVIKVFNLVDLISDYNSLLTSKEENVIFTIDDIKQKLKHDELLDKYDQLLNVYDEYMDAKIHKEKYLSDSLLLLNNVSDYLILNMNINNEKIDGLYKIVLNICDLVKNKYGIYFYNDIVLMLSKIIYKLAYLDSNIQEWSEAHSVKLNEIKAIYVDNYQDASVIAEMMEKLIYQFIEIKLDVISFINIVAVIANENETINKEYCALIIAHGYATASSIANATNKLLGKHVFDAIDMPLDTNAVDIALKIDEYILNSMFVQNLILVVDMGSLEEIATIIRNSEKVKIALINNVSTKMTLSIGEGIINNQSIEEIMDKTCNHSIPNYKIVNRTLKEKAIIFASEAGEAISNRFIQLFKSSLSKKTDVKIISYDYYTIVKNGGDDVIFENYDVLLIVGITKKISKYPFVPFEELLEEDSIYILDNILRTLSFNEQEVNEFNNNILKYFSLENILNTITILNANVLIDLIEDSLRKFEKELSIKLEPKVMYGLFIHLSSLIERLVVKSRGNVYSNIDEFENKHQDFIHNVEKSFEKLTRYYNVKIPLSEIAYLYDYIMNWI